MKRAIEKVSCRVLCRTIICLFWGLPLTAQPVPPGTPERPWWDQFPTIVQTGDAQDAEEGSANASLCGAVDDPTWGIQAQRLRHASASGRIGALHERGIKALTWIESFGTAQGYIVQLQRDDQGQWIRHPADPTLPRVFLNAWGWHVFDGTGEIRWLGIHTYFDPDDVPGAYTLNHPRYGCPPLTYPDGRVALGFTGTASQPWTHRIFDAGCAKTVLGAPYFDNPELNETDTQDDDGSSALTTIPDPGYTPEEWTALRQKRLRDLQTVRFDIGKDTACPTWIDYTRASVRQALDLGIDGVWADNFSPWDSLNACPLEKGFGEWSVAAFRTYLKESFTPAHLTAMGIDDPDHFDVRLYLRQRCSQWGGVPENLRDRTWRDPRWLDDPVWRAYIICKRQLGTRALTAFYATIKEEAQAAGKPDFLVMGNDLPMFGLGWVRGELDMVSTELSWGWGLSAGPRGLMPPPLGSYVPVYKLAREHAKSRFVNIWMYVPKDQLGRPELARTMHYQGLANHTLPMPRYPHVRDAGTKASDAAFFHFVREAAPTFGDRAPVEDAGLYFSTSSQLAAMTPQGVLDFTRQTHAFSFWGWGTALTWMHVPWRAVPEWKLTAATLAGLRLLILPSAEVFAAEEVTTLDAWVRAGGTLVIAGTCGSRLGESGNFERVDEAHSPLAALIGNDPAAAVSALGRGRVLRLNDDPGLPFYLAAEQRPAMLNGFRKTLATAMAAAPPWSLSAPDVPWHVGLTPHWDATTERFFVDVNATRIDLTNDTLEPTPPVSVNILLPEALRGKRLRVHALTPDEALEVGSRILDNGQLRLTVPPVNVYASVIVEATPGPQ